MSYCLPQNPALSEDHRNEDLNFGKVPGRKRDLRWRTFRQNISGGKLIAFHSKPEPARLSKEIVDLIEEKCTDGQHCLNDLQHDTIVLNSQLFPYTTRKSQDTSSAITSCKNNGKHRLEFAGNQIDRDMTLLNALAANNVSYVHGFRSEAFGTEEVHQIPEALKVFERTDLDTGSISMEHTVYCPYLFLNQAETSARHDIEWALNRCALDGSSALRALDMIQKAIRSAEQPGVGQGDLTLFSCAISHNWAVLNHHWISDDQLCMAPLCKFDLRDPSHKYKLQAWIEAIGKWAEVRLLPSFQQSLKILAEWDEVMNDPLNMTPANEFDKLDGNTAAKCNDKSHHLRQASEICPTRSAVIVPASVPATSIGLHFPASTHESTERILSWQRDMSVWHNVPRSAGLLPKSSSHEAIPKSYRPPDEVAEDLENPDDFYTCPSTPAIVLPTTAKSGVRPHLSPIAETGCNPVRKRSQHDLQHWKARDISSAHSCKSSSFTHLGFGNALRHSHSSQDTKCSLPLRSPLFQCHNADNREYTSPPSSVGTHFEEGFMPKLDGCEPHEPPHYHDNYGEARAEPLTTDLPYGYSSIEEWARQQRGLLERDEDEAVLQDRLTCKIDVNQKTKIGLEASSFDNNLLSQSQTASPIGGDRASMTMWIDHVLGQRMICIEEQ